MSPGIFNRRQAMAAMMGGLAALAPGLSVAAGRDNRKLVVILLRGGLDGLATVVPWNDRDYESARGSLAFDPPSSGEGLIDLDGHFGLHPALKPLLRHWMQRELLFVHAAATSYRERSHFDAQAVLENGLPQPQGRASGWLNRALLEIGQEGHPAHAQSRAMAIGSAIPLTLAGSAPVTSWTPSNFIPSAPMDFLTRVDALWRHDMLLGPALSAGMALQAKSDELTQGDTMQAKRGRAAGSAAAFGALAGLAGRMMAAPDGPGVVVLEAGGWDTHAQQGRLTGRLAANLEQFCSGLMALASSAAPVWNRTVVVALSEFGRTVAPNGSSGTDHGTAGLAMVLGGAVAGGHVLSDWPGLAAKDLYEGRDLRPTIDTRSLLKAVLRDHLGLDRTALATTVFPDSGAVSALSGVIRA